MTQVKKKNNKKNRKTLAKSLEAKLETFLCCRCCFHGIQCFSKNLWAFSENSLADARGPTHTHKGVPVTGVPRGGSCKQGRQAHQAAEILSWRKVMLPVRHQKDKITRKCIMMSSEKHGFRCPKTGLSSNHSEAGGRGSSGGKLIKVKSFWV